MFCYSQNVRGAICTCSLTSKLADSLRLIIVIDCRGSWLCILPRCERKIRGDLGIASPESSEIVGKNEMLGRAELEMTAKPS
nr:hypothetical protein [Oscillospiraceae bacterium]